MPQSHQNSGLGGKIALVTGASRGIGAEIATQLATRGATVAVNYVSSKTDGDQVVKWIKDAGGNAVAIQADVTKGEDLDRLFVEVKEAYGRLDILVNSAGAFAMTPLQTLTPESIASMFAINVTAPLLASRHAAALFPEIGGSIVNVSSIITETTPPQFAVYAGTKGALNSITRVLAKELGPRQIRVNAVNAGSVRTDGFVAAGLAGDFEQIIVRNTPLGRLGFPRDIAAAVAFLVSSEASWITGAVLDVAGGRR
jgi:3-oxoacyl-[acyl-carrier protein] reductase